MNKSRIITDSSCDMSLNLENVSIIPKFIKRVNDDTLSLDDYNQVSNSRILSISLLEEEIYNKLVCECINGYNDLIVIVPFNSSSTLYKNAVTRFKESFKCDVTLVNTRLTSTALACLLYDLNDLIDMNHDSSDVLKYMALHERYYGFMLNTKEPLKLELDSKNRVLSNDKVARCQSVSLEKDDIGFKVINYSNPSENSLRAMVNNLRRIIAVDSSIIIGTNTRMSEADSLGEMIFQEIGNESIEITNLSQETVRNFGSSALTLSYKR